MGEHRIMKENKEKKINRVYVIFVLMMAVQLGSIIYCFQTEREGWHSDEIWSYGYANSYYQKDIYKDNDGSPINCQEWISGDTLRDYIIVNEGEEFEYDSIYQNQITDLSPPLHSMVLHTICSFFPEKFSFWYSFVINIAAFLVCMVYLFKTARLLKGDWFALCCCAVYGFSLGARDTYIYLRMYAMCTAMAMIILYNLLVYLKRSDSKNVFNKNMVAISVTAFLGFLTNYYMIVFMGILTFLVCVYYLFRKRIKQMFVVGFSQLVPLLLSFAVFPALLHVTQSHNAAVAADTQAAMNYNFEIRFRILSNLITLKLFGIPVSIYRSGIWPILLGCLVTLVIWICPLIYLLRETKLVKQTFKRVKFFFGHLKQIGKWMLRRINWYYVILAIWIPCQMIVVGETSNLYGMGDYEDRYLMYTYPAAVIIALALVYQIVIFFLKKGKYGKKFVIAAGLLLVVVNIYNRGQYEGYLFEKFTKGQEIEKSVENKECIFVEYTPWVLTAMAPVLMDSKEFFMCFTWDYDDFAEEYKKKFEEGEVVVVIDKSFVKEAASEDEWDENFVQDESAGKSQKLYNEIVDFFEELESDTKMEKVSTATIFRRTMEVYIVNP